MNCIVGLCGENMSYKNLNIKKSYETSGNKNSLLEDFYIPFLSETKEYRRIAGFFSSSSLIVASEGIEGLIKNNGIMKLLISPNLSQEDYEIICKTKCLDSSLSMFNEFNDNNFPNNDRLEALSWMLRNNRLEIKIVVNKNSINSLFHQKVGIGFDSEGNQLSFSGSINETAQAWLDNIEEFKTFKSWENDQYEYLLTDLKKFNSYWNNERQDVAFIYDIPESIKKKIINISPRDVSDLMIMRKYKKDISEKNSQLNLFDHQLRALKMWEDNGYQLLMEMATGTGKTRTAIGCFMILKAKLSRFLVIVATPQSTLSRQWKNDVEHELNICFDQSIVVDSSNHYGKKEFEKLILDLNSGLKNNGIIYTTHNTASSNDFTNIIKNYGNGINILFICDEVHGIASDKQKLALLDIYQYRIGLSATPERMYDEVGTNLIRTYFGNRSFEFSIKDALNTINPLTGMPFLNHFYYYPCFVYLNDKELAKYKDYSRKIAVVKSQEDCDEELLNRFYIERAEILKNAEGKLVEVENIIDHLNQFEKIQDTIIFAGHKQIEDVLIMLGKKGIIRSKVTDEESTSKIVGVHGNTEREETIDQFRNGNVQVIVGMKCLDEGIDIKNARIAILMASSTNPREYVQRIGRVIRITKGKKPSIIYDLIVTTLQNDITNSKILAKEGNRVKQIACNAINYDEVKEIFLKNGVDLNYD